MAFVRSFRANFNPWAATTFNALDLIDNKLVCARVANDVRGNSMMFQTRFTR